MSISRSVPSSPDQEKLNLKSLKLFLHFTCRDLGLDIHETLLNDRRESARWDEGAVDVGLRDQGLGAEDKGGVSEAGLLEVAVHQEVDLRGES